LRFGNNQRLKIQSVKGLVRQNNYARILRNHFACWRNQHGVQLLASESSATEQVFPALYRAPIVIHKGLDFRLLGEREGTDLRRSNHPQIRLLRSQPVVEEHGISLPRDSL